MVEWLNDNLCNKCCRCDTNFTFFRRKHHCRICGYIFCYKCIQNKEITVNYETKVCLLCIKKEKKTYITYLLDELYKKDLIIEKLKITQKKIIENKFNKIFIDKKKENFIDNSVENTIKENKFNIAEYLKNLK